MPSDITRITEYTTQGSLLINATAVRNGFVARLEEAIATFKHTRDVEIMQEVVEGLNVVDWDDENYLAWKQFVDQSVETVDKCLHLLELYVEVIKSAMEAYEAQEQQFACASQFAGGKVSKNYYVSSDGTTHYHGVS